MSFKVSVFWSVLVHAALLTLHPSFAGALPFRNHGPYVMVELKKSIEVSPPPVATARTEPAVPSTAPPEKRPEIPRPAPRSSHPAPAPIPAPVPIRAVPKEVREPPIPLPPSPRPVTALPNWEFLAIQHKQRVRAYLKSHLQYPAVQVKGTVRMRLNLTAEGILKRAEVLETSDPHLTQAALDDARAAAPYPRFLPGMKRRSTSYEFLVRYEPE